MMLTAVLAVTLVPGGLGLPTAVLGLVSAIAAAILILTLALLYLPGERMRHLRIAVGRSMGREVLPLQIALSLGTATANLLAFDACARATGTALPLSALMVLVPLIITTMLLPISISGWGLREGAAAALFPLAGASSEAGLAASIAFGLVFLVSTLPGIAILLATTRRRVSRD